jgi:hypothetical protein
MSQERVESGISLLGLTGRALGTYNLTQEVKMRTSCHPDVHSLAVKIQPELLRVIAALPQLRQAEVLDFARSLRQLAEHEVIEARPETRIELRLAPADTLLRLTDLVARGGDALLDSEALYDDNGSH